MNGIIGEDSASSSEKEEEVIGIRSSRHRTNWWFHYDALNQQDVALLAHLQMQSDSIFTQIQGILVAIGILTTMLAVCRQFRIFQAATDGKLVKIIQLLTVVVAMCQGQQLTILDEMKDILLIHSTQRVFHPFPPKKNRKIDDLSDNISYEMRSKGVLFYF